MVLVEIDPGVSHPGCEIVSHYTTDMRQKQGGLGDGNREQQKRSGIRILEWTTKNNPPSCCNSLNEQIVKGQKKTKNTHWQVRCELTSVKRHIPVLTSHSLMVLSRDPDITKGPGLCTFFNWTIKFHSNKLQAPPNLWIIIKKSHNSYLNFPG